MKKSFFLLLAGFCLGAGAAPAAATPESRAAVLFLLVEPGARAQAMGESYVAIADDATASYFNPAALSGQTRRKLNLTHMPWLPGLADDINYEFLAYSQPVTGWGNVGMNIALLDYGEQQRTDERGVNQGTFRSYDVALTGAYGAEIGRNLSAGIGLKFIRSNLAAQGAGKEKGKGIGNSFAADLGLLWKLYPRFTLAATLRNLGPKIAYIDASQADPLPQHFILGMAYQVLDTQYHDMLVSMDIYKPLIADGSFLVNLGKAWADESMRNEIEEMDLHLGGEYRYGLSPRKEEAFFAMRGGYSLDHDGEVTLKTAGIGLKYNLFQVDVAYIFGSDNPHDNSTRYSMNLSF
jgi:hypothetical protein